MIRSLLILSLFFLFGFSFSQQTITGKIMDLQSGESLPGVTVFIPDYLQGAVSDADGNYQISKVRTGKLLIQFTFIGYKTVIKDIEITDQDLVLDIKMEPTIIQSDEIVVTGSFTGSQHENVVRINRVSSKEITETASPSFIESVTAIPGVSLISKGPGIGTPVIRGLSLSNIIVLNNGLPVENYQFSENHPFMVDEYGVDKVEIIKGPASLLYGSGAVGGVMNIIKSPPLPKGKIKGDFGIKYFSNTEGISTNLGVNGNNNNFLWGVRGGINSNKDYFDGANSRVPNSRFNRKSLKFHTGILRTWGSLRLFYDFNKDDLGLTVPGSIAQVTENSRENEIWYQNLENHILTAMNKFFIGNTKIDFNMAFQQNHRKLIETDMEDGPAVDMRLNTLSYTAKSHFPISKLTNLIAGIQGMHQNNKNFEAPEKVLPDASINDISVFLVGQHLYWEMLKIEAGLRYDFRSIHVPLQESGGGHEHKSSFEEEGETIELDRTYSNFNASLGSVLELSEIFQIRFNLASAFRSPNLAELTQDGMHGTRFEQGNPDLVSQRNLEADLDFHFHTKHTTIDLSGFYNSIFNYIYLSPTTDTLDDGDPIYRYLQTDATIYGGEAALHIHPHPYDWLHIKASYAYILGKQKKGEYLPFIPANKFTYEVEIHFRAYHKLKKFYIRAGGSSSFNQNHPGQFETSTDGYTLLNAGIGGDLNIFKQKLNIGIFANNLLNKTYIDHLSTLKGIGINNIGRNISISLKCPLTIKSK